MPRRSQDWRGIVLFLATVVESARCTSAVLVDQGAVLASARCTAPSWSTRARWRSWPPVLASARCTARRGRPGHGGRAGRRGGDLGEVHGAVAVDQGTVIELAAAVVTSARCTAPSRSTRAR